MKAHLAVLAGIFGLAAFIVVLMAVPVLSLLAAIVVLGLLLGGVFDNPEQRRRRR